MFPWHCTTISPDTCVPPHGLEQVDEACVPPNGLEQAPLLVLLQILVVKSPRKVSERRGTAAGGGKQQEEKRER